LEEGQVPEQVNYAKILKDFHSDLSPVSRNAMALQMSIKDDEIEQLKRGVDYSDQHTRLSTVHARQDLVLVCSYLHSIAESNHTMLVWVALIGWTALFTFAVDVVITMMKAVHLWPWPV
jgi:hypothetical protein